MKVEIHKGISHKSGTPKEWKALKITIGDWSQLIFTKTKFEWDYLINELGLKDSDK